MFNIAAAFQRDLSGWDVSNVRTMDATFARASSFDVYTSTNFWDVSNVDDARFTFDGLSYEALCGKAWVESTANGIDAANRTATACAPPPTAFSTESPTPGARTASPTAPQPTPTSAPSTTTPTPGPTATPTAYPTLDPTAESFSPSSTSNTAVAVVSSVSALALLGAGAAFFWRKKSGNATAAAQQGVLDDGHYRKL